MSGTNGKSLSGHKFGRLEVGPRAPDGNGGHRRYVCQCDCGNFTIVLADHLRSGHTKSCGCWQREVIRARVGPLHPNWKGGRTITQEGYVYLKDRDHPNSDAQGYVSEHVKVMAEAIGRPLRKGETVHHRSGRRDQNNIENLELWAKAHGPGQRVEDLVAAAEETLRMYKPSALAPVKPLVSRTYFPAVSRM